MNDRETPVSVPQLVREFQTRLMAFVRGEDMEWATYGRAERLYNVTDEFQATTMASELRIRCDLINKLVLDPANGA